MADFINQPTNQPTNQPAKQTNKNLIGTYYSKRVAMSQGDEPTCSDKSSFQFQIDHLAAEKGIISIQNPEVLYKLIDMLMNVDRHYTWAQCL